MSSAAAIRMAIRPSPAQLAANIHDARRLGADFLIADLELALTMLEVAATTGDTETARRARAAARST